MQRARVGVPHAAVPVTVSLLTLDFGRRVISTYWDTHRARSFLQGMLGRAHPTQRDGKGVQKGRHQSGADMPAPTDNVNSDRHLLSVAARTAGAHALGTNGRSVRHQTRCQTPGHTHRSSAREEKLWHLHLLSHGPTPNRWARFRLFAETSRPRPARGPGSTIGWDCPPCGMPSRPMPTRSGTPSAGSRLLALPSWR